MVLEGAEAHHALNVLRLKPGELVTVLDYGKLLAVGEPDEVRNNKDVIDAYLGVSHD